MLLGGVAVPLSLARLQCCRLLTHSTRCEVLTQSIRSLPENSFPVLKVVSRCLFPHRLSPHNVFSMAGNMPSGPMCQLYLSPSGDDSEFSKGPYM